MLWKEPKDPALIAAQNKALETVSQMIIAAMRDPDSPESANRIRLSAAKLKGAKLDIHDVRLAGPEDLKLSMTYRYEDIIKRFRVKSLEEEAETAKFRKKYSEIRIEYDDLKRRFNLAETKRIQLRERVKELEAALLKKLTVEPLRETILHSLLPVYRTIRDLMQRMNTQVDSRVVLKELNAMKAEGLVLVSSAHSHWKLNPKEADV